MQRCCCGEQLCKSGWRPQALSIYSVTDCAALMLVGHAACQGRMKWAAPFVVEAVRFGSIIECWVSQHTVVGWCVIPALTSLMIISMLGKALFPEAHLISCCGCSVLVSALPGWDHQAWFHTAQPITFGRHVCHVFSRKVLKTYNRFGNASQSCRDKKGVALFWRACFRSMSRCTGCSSVPGESSFCSLSLHCNCHNEA